MGTALAHETPFTAIACAARRKILDALRDDERSVGFLVDLLGVSQPTVSQHLRVLKDAGLVDDRSVGRFKLYRLKADPLVEVMSWVKHYEKFWHERLTALDAVLKE